MNSTLQKMMITSVLLMTFTELAYAAKRNEPLHPHCNINITEGRTQSPCSVSEFASLWNGEKKVIPTQSVGFTNLKSKDGLSYSSTLLQISATEQAIGKLDSQDNPKDLGQIHSNVNRIIPVKIISITHPAPGEVTGGKINVKILNENEGIDNFGQYWWDSFTGQVLNKELYNKFNELSTHFYSQLETLDVSELVPYVQYEIEVTNQIPGYIYETNTFVFMGVKSHMSPPIQTAGFYKSWNRGLVELNTEVREENRAWTFEYSEKALRSLHKIMNADLSDCDKLLEATEHEIFEIPQKQNYIPFETAIPFRLIRYYELKSEEASTRGRVLSLKDNMALASAYGEFLKFYPVRFNVYDAQNGYIKNDSDIAVINQTKFKLKMINLLIESQKRE